MTSVKRMVLAKPGLIQQVSGTLTQARYWVATMISDQASEYVHCYLVRGTTDEETIQLKAAYEIFLGMVGVRVRGYRAYNGSFSNNLFKQ